MNPLIYDASFVQPCRVRLLVVPIGKWKRQEFSNAVTKLRKYNEVRLLDITPIDSSLFTPQGFPNGRLFFEIDTSGHQDALNLFLYDFEPFRKIFVVVGLVNDDSDATTNLKILKEKFPTVISHNLIYFGGKNTVLENDEHAFYCESDYELNLETIICDIGRNFLHALSHYYSSYKHVTLRSPGAIGGNSVLKTAFTRQLIGASVSVSSSSSSSKRATLESTTGSIKRSASLKLAKSLSASENKSQTRSQGRQCKILGNFQLLAGRYMDALNSFTEAVTHLYKVRDHLWLASALDGVAICFLLLTFLKVSFQIPSIVMLIIPVQTSGNSMEINSARSNATPPSKSPRNSSSTLALNQDFDVESVNLPLLIKMIAEKILYYYELSLNHHCDYAPQVVYAETLLKTLTFMVACRSSTRLTQPVLEKIIKGNALKQHEEDDEGEDEDDGSSLPHDPEELLFTKTEIYSFANKTFELQLKEMDIESQTNVYILLSKVYHSLGFKRKRLFVLRLLLVALLANQEPIIWYSEYQDILEEMVKLYGITDRKPGSSVEDSQAVTWLTLQKKCLQLCLMVARKMNSSDLASRYAVMLASKYTHLLTQSEQQNLFGVYLQPYMQGGFIRSYWDPFLLRDVKLARLESEVFGDELPIESEVATLNNKLDSSVAIVHPEEIFNPFRHLLAAEKIAAENSTTTLQNVFLVGDRAIFSCMVQNPYKYEISITGVQFNSKATKFCELGKSEVNLKRPYYVSPESIRIINIPLELKSPTHHDWLDIDSIRLSVMGMPMEDFPIAISENRVARADLANDRFNPGKVQIKILPEQPELQLLRTDNMTDNSWMMLHGTKQRFKVTLRNKSLKCPIEHLQFLHATNIEQSVKPDYWKKMQLDDLHAFESQLEWLKNSCVKVLNPPQRMEPNETRFFDLEVDATAAPFHFNAFDLVINYGMNANDKSRVYLKRLQSSYNVTLKRSIEVPSVEIVPLNENFASEVDHVDWVHYLLQQEREDSQFNISNYLLLLLDVRNSWIDSIKIQVRYENFVSHEHVIETHHTTRVVVPISKLNYQDYNFKRKPIPRVWQGRQYIQSGLTEEQEIDMREKFWCREHILSRLQCNWTLSTDDSVEGTVNFRQFVEKFDARMLSSLYEAKSPYHIFLSIDKRTVAKGQPVNAVVRVSPTSISDPTAPLEPEMLSLNFMIFDNHTARLLTKSDKRVLFNGTLSRCLRVTKPVETALQLLPIEKGNYEICACISRPSTSDQVLQFNPGLVTFTVV